MAFENEFSFDASKMDSIDENREDDFELETGRFRDDETGHFERGSPPKDYDADVDRFRALDGSFKDRSADLLDEPAEALSGDPSFEG